MSLPNHGVSPTQPGEYVLQIRGGECPETEEAYQRRMADLETLLVAAEASKGMYQAYSLPRDDLQPRPCTTHLGSYTDPFKVDWTLYEDGSVMRVAPDGTSYVSYVDAPVVVILKILQRADPTLKEAFAAKFNFPVI